MALQTRLKEPLDNKWSPAKKSIMVPSPQKVPAVNKAEESPAVDPGSFEIKTDPTECATSIEFLLSTLVTKMRIRPNQALALLSNSNKLLIHVIIKGLKGDYAPVTEWYKELFTHCSLLLNLVESEPAEALSATLQILDIFKAGLFAKNSEVSNWALRLLGKIAAELTGKGKSGIAWDWFVAENGGLQAVMGCVEKNKELVGENVVSVLCQFGRYNYMELFTHYLKMLFSEGGKYMEVVGGLIQLLAEYKSSKDELVNAGVVAFWIDFACRKGDTDNPNTSERAAALSLLQEIWLHFPNVVEEKPEYTDFIIRLLQRASRDRNLNIQLVSLSLLFKLLETFAVEKNPFAPVVYKSLTFALVENHAKTTVREFILQNFVAIFETFSTIPVSILMDPLIKQIRASDGVTFGFNLFDFEFFGTLAKHPKLGIKNAIQTLDLLAKPYIYSQIFAGVATGPFVTIAGRFRSNPVFATFMQKLIQADLIFLSEENPKWNHKKIYALGVYCGNVKKLAGNPRMKSKGEERILIEAQNARIIELISKIISLGNDSLNDSLKDLIIESNTSLKPLLKGNDENFLVLLHPFGDPEELLNSSPPPPEEDPDDFSNDLQRDVQSFSTPPPAPISHKKPHMSGKKPPVENRRASRKVSAQPQPTVKSFINSGAQHQLPYEDDSEAVIKDDRSAVSDKEVVETEFKKKTVAYPKEYTLVPYKQLTLLEEKALLEIERVKQKKEERIQKKRIEENRKLIQEMKRKKEIQQQLEIRKVEHGVATRNIKDAEYTMILDEGVYEKAAKKPPEIGLHVLEDEEDRDYEALKLFVEQHRKVFRYLYNRYANSGFSSKPKASFDALKEKLGTISMAEIIKMLKDHNVTFRMLSQAELAAFIRLVNFKLIHRNDLTALTHEGFIELFIQLAIYVFSKEPFNAGCMPPVYHVQSLLEHFKQAAKIKGENTVLYDNPNATSLGDPELMAELTKFLETNPFYPLPEGYKKVEEKYLNENYVIPNYVQLPESTRCAVEILDEVLSSALGVHVLEPITTYEYKVKVVPTIGKVYQRDPNEKKFMLPITKTLRKGILDPVKRPISLKQLNVKEIEPKLTAAMKLEVVKARHDMKGIIKEVAEVVGEIVQAVEEGRDTIGAKLKWGPSAILNKAIKEKLDRKKEEDAAKEEKERQRKARADSIKKAIQEMKREKAVKEKEDADLLRKQKDEEKKKILKEKQQFEERKKKLLEEKQRREGEAKKVQEEEAKKNEVEKKRKAEEMKELKRRKNEQFKRDLKNIIEAREKAAKVSEEQKRVQEQKLAQHKKIVTTQLMKEKEKREESKQQKAMLQDFMKRADIITLLTKHRKQLRHVFRYFSRSDTLEISHDLMQDITTLDLSKFSKLCVVFRIVPQLMSAEDAVQTFRHCVKAKIDRLKEQGKHTGKDTQHVEYGDFEEVLIRVALLTKNRLNEAGAVVEGEANKTYDTTGADGKILGALMSYMKIRPDDTKITLDQKLNSMSLESKKVAPAAIRRKDKRLNHTVAGTNDKSMAVSAEPAKLATEDAEPDEEENGEEGEEEGEEEEGEEEGEEEPEEEEDQSPVPTEEKKAEGAT